MVYCGEMWSCGVVIYQCSRHVYVCMYLPSISLCVDRDSTRKKTTVVGGADGSGGARGSAHFIGRRSDDWLRIYSENGQRGQRQRRDKVELNKRVSK